MEPARSPSLRARLLACCRAITARDVPRGKLQWLSTYPRWLRWTLLREAKTIRSYLSSDQAQLSPAEARERLENFRRAALLLGREMNDHAIVAHLRNYGEAGGHSGLIVHQVLLALSTQAADAIARIPAGRGVRTAPAFDPSSTISGQQLCAWVVREAIEYHTGKRPGVRSPQAIDAAIALIAMAGGPDIGSEGWVKHFRDVHRLEQSNGYVGHQLRLRKIGFASQPGAV